MDPTGPDALPAGVRRHALLLPDERAWRRACDASPHLAGLAPDAAALVRSWVSRGWPVMVRRLLPDDRPGALPVALPLPPAFDKRRLAFSLPAEAGGPAAAAARLADAAPAAPMAWQATITRLLELGAACGTAPRVFGALLWQHLTGLAYLGPRSDLDLLWTPAADRLPHLLEMLVGLDRTAPMRLDGEIVGAEGIAANWRELAVCGVAAPVLLKTMRQARLGVFPAKRAMPA